MPNLVIKMMMSYLMTAEQTTLSVRERIGNYTPLLVSYSAERYESATTWMHRQIERVNTVFIYILKVKLYRNDFTKEY